MNVILSPGLVVLSPYLSSVDYTVWPVKTAPVAGIDTAAWNVLRKFPESGSHSFVSILAVQRTISDRFRVPL